MEIETPQPFGILQNLEGRVHVPFRQAVYEYIQSGECPDDDLIEYAQALDFLGMDGRLEETCKRLADLKKMDVYPTLFHRIARHLDIDTRRQLNIYDKLQIPNLDIPVKPYMFRHVGDLMISIDREKDVYCFIRHDCSETIFKYNGNYVTIYSP